MQAQTAFAWFDEWNYDVRDYDCTVHWRQWPQDHPWPVYQQASQVHRILQVSLNPTNLDKFSSLVPQKLHSRHGGLNLFIGVVPTTKKELFSHRNFTNNHGRITSKTLLMKAKIAMKTCKKFLMGFVTALGFAYCFGTFHQVWTGMATSNGEWTCRMIAIKTRLKRKDLTSPCPQQFRTLLLRWWQDKLTKREAGRWNNKNVFHHRSVHHFFNAGVGFHAWALWEHPPSLMILQLLTR